jgi:hypothetical protein
MIYQLNNKINKKGIYMPMVIGGLVTLKPVGGVVSNSPTTAQAQIDAQQREAQRQAKVDALVDKLAAQNQAAQPNPPVNDKKWTVPFNK